MPFNKGYAEKIDVMIFYDLRYQNPKKNWISEFCIVTLFCKVTTKK